MILLLYFIPIAIIFIICYIDMDKGETVEEYLKSFDKEIAGLVCILTFLPVVNIFTSIMFMFFFIFGIFHMITNFIIDKIKHIKK